VGIARIAKASSMTILDFTPTTKNEEIFFSSIIAD
jgi:hypothetical protein